MQVLGHFSTPGWLVWLGIPVVWFEGAFAWLLDGNLAEATPGHGICYYIAPGFVKATGLSHEL